MPLPSRARSVWIWRGNSSCAHPQCESIYAVVHGNMVNRSWGRAT